MSQSRAATRVAPKAFVVAAALAAATTIAPVPRGSMPSPQSRAGRAPVSRGQAEGLPATVKDSVRLAEYQVASQPPARPDDGPAYQAPNRAQNLRTSFSREGIRIQPRSGDTTAWQLGLTLRGIGTGDRTGPVATPEIVAEANRIEYRRGAVREWYVNDAKGLEQGFTIAERPAGDREGALRLGLAIDSILTPALVDGGQAVEFSAANGEKALRYAELTAFDAAGRVLPSHMELSPRGDEVALVVEDRGAVYPVTIDPLATNPAWTAESDQQNGNMGYSVAGAGDVNNDTFADVIVSAPSFDNGPNLDRGRAYVFHGSATGLSAVANWMVEGTQNGALFGQSVSSAGDVNNDGFDDVLVGADAYDNGEVNEGRVSLYYGSALGLSTTAAWTAEGNQADAHLGFFVARAGDVNNDGYGDVVIGAYLYDNGETDEGRAYVYYGSASGLAATPDWTAEGDQAGAEFGRAVASAGDVNNDGFDDVVIGVRLYDGAQADNGRAVVYLGSAIGLATTPAWTVNGSQLEERFGYSVASAGDVNGDTYDDVVIGATRWDAGQDNEGRVYLFLGSATGLATTPSWTRESNDSAAFLGTSVASAGDVNNDGFADVIVAAPYFDNDQVEEGRVWVYLGSASGLSTTATVTLDGNQASSVFGNQVASAGDVNADGYDDIIIGGPQISSGQFFEGRAFVYLGLPHTITLGLTTSSSTVGEGAGSLTLNVTLTTSDALPSAVVTSVQYATANGSAQASADYNAASGTLTFPAGTASGTTQSIVVTLLDDTLDEASESFTVNLSSFVTASAGTAAHTVTLTDDDVAPTLSVDDVTVTEGDSGTVNAVFTVSLSAASGQTVTVSYATANGSALAPSDYAATSGTLTFNSLITTQTVTVPVNGDLSDETNETFVLDLSVPVNASLTDSQGQGTITDDDGPPSITINDLTVTEGNTGTVNAVFTVSLSAPSAFTVTTDFATADDTGVAPGDYTATSGSLTFTPGTPSLTVTVLVKGDVLDEVDETFFVNLTNPGNATIGDGQAVGTISDDELPPTLSVNDVTVTEGDSGTVNAIFTVSLSASSGLTATVGYATANNTASSPADYAATGGTLTFTPGVTSQTVTVAVNGDTTDEVNETFFVNLSGPGNATIADDQGVGTITDDDASPSLSINDVAVTEGDSGTVSAIFTVTLSAVSSLSVTADFATADIVAAAPADYTATSGTVSFAPGITSQTITVAAKGDILDEVNETFGVNLSNPVSATINDGQGVGTINDDDPTPTLSINDPAPIIEGNTGTATVLFTVNLSAASGQTVTVNYATDDGTALAPGDYTQGSGTLTFTPGTTSQTFTVTVNGDTLDEPDENFVVNLSSAVNASIADTQGIGTISDNDPAPSLTINDVTVVEGDTGPVNAVFTVSLSAASGRSISVGYATADVTANAPSDYASTSGTLAFPPGTTSQTITVVTKEDTVIEGNETFQVDLSSPSNATLGDAQGLGTLTDNDAVPVVSIDDVAATEGNSGTVNATFTVTLSNPTGQTVTVNFATAPASATAGTDYASSSGTLTFTPGTTTQVIPVSVFGDLLDEVNETFTVTLSNLVNGTMGDSQGVGTINDDDATPTLAVNDVTVTEGSSGTVNAVFTVSLSAASGQAVTVDYDSADVTAVAPGDYSGVSGALTFTPGTTSQTVTVAVSGDLLDEANETFNLSLSNPGNAGIADGQGVGTINDDDATPTLSINDVTVTEGNSGTVNAVFTVTLSAASGRTVTVDHATANVSATAGTDYAAASGTLTFAVGGATTQTVTVVVNGDTATEPAETFNVNLTNPANATLLDGQGVGTIGNDDGPSGPKAEMSSPIPGSTLTGSTQTFTWAAGTISTAYWLEVGTTPGGKQIYPGAQTAALSATVSGLPTNGSTVYVRLWSLAPNWIYNDYVYTAATLASGKAVISTPTPGSTLTGSSQTFTWTTGTGVTAYWLEVGTSVGGKQIYPGASTTNLSANVTGLPTNGSTVYVRLWSLLSGTWVYNDYTYTAASLAGGKAAMSSPTPGSTLTSTSVTFNWTTGTNVTAYWLEVGTTVGGKQIYPGAQTTNLSAVVSGLPSNGSTVYVRLWSLLGGAWVYNDYTYVALTSASSKSDMVSPTPGSTLTSSSVIFTWSTGTNVTAYWLEVGTTPGGNQIYPGASTTNLSATVSGLPTNGSTVYVRLWSLLNNAWVYNSYTYVATNTPGAKAQMSTPTPGSTLAGSTQTFTWTTGTNVTAYWLQVGTTVGGTQIYPGASTTNFSATVTGLPTNGSTVYVRLWSFLNGAWVYNDYTYTASSPKAVMTSPTPGSTLSGSTVTFQWSAGTGVTAYWLEVGTTLGGKQIYPGTSTPSLSATVTGIPTDGSTVYVRLWSQIGTWVYNDYTYTSGP